MKLRPPPELTLSNQARDALQASARASRQREHGGILVGFRTKTGLFIEDALLVADDFATHSQYLRRSNEAQRVLGAYLRVQTDITVGYVGEWHTHPLPLPPSSTDRDTMRAIALGNSDQTGLIVVALDIELNSVSYHGLVSDLRSGVRKRLGKYRRGTVCFESPELSI